MKEPRPDSAVQRGRLRPLALATAVVASLLAGGLVAGPPAHADVPEQEPGVTMRVYDLGVPLTQLCTLRAGQTPNIDKLMPTIDWSTEAEFGFANNFATHVLGNITVPETGVYDFEFRTDDGARLFIADELVIDNDGLHGADPVEASVELTAGMHSLFIEHFEAGGDQQITLSWRPPGTSEFVVVPEEALSTDAGVVRVTAPGRKYCEGATDTSGDGLPLDAVHPAYDLTDLRPAGFTPQVSGMAFTEDDDLVITTWGGTDNSLGEVYVLDGTTGDTGPEEVTYRKVAEGLTEPMGVAVVDGTIYVSQKHELTALEDHDGDGVTDEYRTVATWPYGGNFHEFAFGLLYEDDHFYLNLSVSINYGGATTVPQPAPGRGTTIKVHKDTGEVTTLAGGLRTPNGIGWGADGEIFVTDNQGDWLPSSKLLLVEEGAFFNHFTTPTGPFDDNAVTRPVVWFPQNEIGNSPTTPVLLEEGPFAGQLVVGDVTYGGLQRVALDEVNGRLQGAVFRHTQGLEAGVNRVALGPDGAIYVGGLGAGGNWGQEGKLLHGLQKLTLNGTEAFDILDMRATGSGFELEYTRPLSEETVDKLAEAYQVTQWRYVPTAAYGGPKVGEETLPVTAATLSEDGTTVTLEIPGLRRDRVVHVRSPRPFASVDDEELWSTEAWYTLNEIPGVDGDQPETFYEAEEGTLAGGADVDTEHAGYSGAGFVDAFGEEGASTTLRVTVEEAGAYDVSLRYSNGPNPFAGDKTVSVYVNGDKHGQTVLPSTVTWKEWATKTELLDLEAGTNTVEYRVDEGDTGHVNLDLVIVRPHGERITLFDGTGLSEWQHTDGRTGSWLVEDGYMEVRNGDLRTLQGFEDYRLHVEFWLPEHPPEVTGQQRANSGVYQQERYEIQVLDSFGIDPPKVDDAAAIYNHKAPDVNAATAPETWQTYDIEFRAARYDGLTKVEDARVTVVWNGVTVHDDVAIPGGTGGNIPEGPATGSIRLQDHNDPGPQVRFRNVWIEPLSGAVAPQVEATAEIRCVAGRATVAVRAVNVGDSPVDVRLETAFGARSVVDVAPGAVAYQSFATRSASLDAGEAHVTAGGQSLAVPYEAASCG